MMTAQLIRTETSDQGTFGLLSVGGFVCHTAEPPWRENLPGVSCIPPGLYEVEPWNSRRFPATFHLLNVPARSAILIHAGNVAGDPSRGWRRHSLGCILPGLRRGWIEKQRAVLLSAPALSVLREAVGPAAWLLAIEQGR